MGIAQEVLHLDKVHKFPRVIVKFHITKAYNMVNWTFLLLPPKLYLVLFYQVSLVNWTKITCSDFRRPSVLLQGSFVILYHMFISHGRIVINVIA